MSIFQDQAEFMSAGAQHTKHYCENQELLYADLITEEFNEFYKAYSGADHAETVKEVVDIIVVAAGFLISLLGEAGAQKAWNCVHENNLKKLGGKTNKREDGKILKGVTDKAEMKAALLEELKALLL